ncbi:ATP synthase F0 subcomplex A subunit [Coriobacterium glomerans PW2]|uniref:ATP synthase subunit a n=1 Tax=Coriobacterium glomerans (strain ATCC 49209 / DSM 20642 / JCM 10262 / PW2) TaxID=700015 RepID=F2NAC5_CORGP|nr:F0F1 ATP synthase subunit A [Coriobacterium glomerans]AEB06311.1 ATP synthase F0 subcomplex A subunit [Coriobacterium glomerans PW2]
MDALTKLPGEISQLVSEFSSTPVVGNLDVGLTQYSFWLLVSAAVFVIIVAVFLKKQTLVPKGVFVNGVESIVEYVENDVAKGVVGSTWRHHFPFLATLFLFILVNNFIGLIPGAKPGTGAIGCTAAVALISFVYFIYFGVKKHGVWGYIKSLAPAGVGFPMNLLVWVIELLSLILRLVTLAVRLFCNMFAGHVVMGSFAILASLFIEPVFTHFSLVVAGWSLTSIGWLAILLIIYAVELIVAFVQAYVFTVLSAVYIQIAEADEH